ncbi:YbaB/EbfC family nucleoid-associated protein [Lentzea sp. DG1S-22]|uniref:YbaB/EbfC family nucleoid-associated protein n=1 Tax=Lentzea sp. DG1S-22 TaxID=3108822 RepID=UPI002E7A3707|nr:YbaB/EbfC family nucleoid-associated protein [Lentzea sp. DG1S-22]WVH82397.1 YbaB/EbfC family nucleoid-associated protein [Lentzea sp. DG1S-22]
MSTPLHNELDGVLADLKEQQGRITEAVGRLESAETTVVTEDRMIQATVDAKGKLTGLKLTGRRWRDLAPKELTARIVEVVNRAQDKAAEQTAELVAPLLPPGVSLDSMLGSTPDLQGMFKSAMEDLTAGKWLR